MYTQNSVFKYYVAFSSQCMKCFFVIFFILESNIGARAFVVSFYFGMLEVILLCWN